MPTDNAGFRGDIHALRVLAVFGVVLFHLAPAFVPGGFIGVDVFLVLAGYFATVSALKRIESGASFDYWQTLFSRVMRVTPAALAVIAAVVVGIVAFANPQHWEQFFTETTAASLHYENWLLAENSVDYWAVSNVRSPVQHFWYLSLLMQFYVVWPLLLRAFTWVANRVSAFQLRSVLAISTGALALVSFIFGVSVTYSPEGGYQAYFMTHTRGWELLVGALLALLPAGFRVTNWVKWTSFLSWAVLAFSMLFFSFDVVFLSGELIYPGWVALLPVAATALIVVSDMSSVNWYTKLVSLPPLRFLGDISFTLYLWHLPLIVLLLPWFSAAAAEGSLIVRLSKVVLLVLALGLAALTHRFVEKPGAFQLRALIICVFITGLLVAACQYAKVYVNQRAAASLTQLTRLIESDTACLGAEAMFAEQPCSNPELADVYIPENIGDIANYGQDYRDIEAQIWTEQHDRHPKMVSVGVSSPDALRVVLVGDSHAAQWAPHLKEIALRNNWLLDIVVGLNGRNWAAVSLDDTTRAGDVRRLLFSAVDYDVVITTQSRWYDSDAALLADTYSALAAAGRQVLVIADNPRLSDAAYECLVAATNYNELSKCELSREDGLNTVDSQIAAVQLAAAHTAAEKVALVDLTDAYCTAERCPLLIGQVPVYEDDSHLTYWYTATMAKYLEKAVLQALADS
ncbi:MAG: acyltransferase [Propionibacteriaceae bacterium]|nr:acyltransferase [Propionibacteriaceae bacterium]